MKKDHEFLKVRLPAEKPRIDFRHKHHDDNARDFLYGPDPKLKAPPSPRPPCNYCGNGVRRVGLRSKDLDEADKDRLFCSMRCAGLWALSFLSRNKSVAPHVYGKQGGKK